MNPICECVHTTRLNSAPDEVLKVNQYRKGPNVLAYRNVIEYRKEEWDKSQFYELLTTYPDLKASDNARALADIVYFLFLDSIHSHYRHIDRDIEREKQSYKSRVAREQDGTEHASLTCYGVFDVDQMHEPEVKEDKLIFFVLDTTGVPSRITMHLKQSDKRKYPYEIDNLPRVPNPLAVKELPVKIYTLDSEKQSCIIL